MKVMWNGLNVLNGHDGRPSECSRRDLLLQLSAITKLSGFLQTGIKAVRRSSAPGNTEQGKAGITSDEEKKVLRDLFQMQSSSQNMIAFLIGTSVSYLEEVFHHYLMFSTSRSPSSPAHPFHQVFWDLILVADWDIPVGGSGAR